MSLKCIVPFHGMPVSQLENSMSQGIKENTHIVDVDGIGLMLRVGLRLSLCRSHAPDTPCQLGNADSGAGMGKVREGIKRSSKRSSACRRDVPRSPSDSFALFYRLIDHGTRPGYLVDTHDT